MLLVSQVDLINSVKNEVLACFVIAVTQLVWSGGSIPLSTLCRVYEEKNVAQKKLGKSLEIYMQRYALTCQKTLY